MCSSITPYICRKTKKKVKYSQSLFSNLSPVKGCTDFPARLPVVKKKTEKKIGMWETRTLDLYQAASHKYEILMEKKIGSFQYSEFLLNLKDYLAFYITLPLIFKTYKLISTNHIYKTCFTGTDNKYCSKFQYFISVQNIRCRIPQHKTASEYCGRKNKASMEMYSMKQT